MYSLLYLLNRIKYKLQQRLIPFYYTNIAKLKLKTFELSYGSGLYVDGKFLFLTPKGRIRIGNNFKLNSRYKSNLVGLTNPATFQVIKKGLIEIGNNSGFSSPVLSSRKLIKIGNNVKMGGNVRIYDHDYHSLNYLNRRPGINESNFVLSKEIIIGNDVFIGVNSIILKGVKIGDRCIIGASSVLANMDIPPDSIVAGNPARIIKKN